MATIRLEGLTKRFGDLVAVDELDLEVPEGTSTCLLGPSGCGKTTTLRMIAGLETPSGGEIYFDALPVTNVPAERRGVGLVFQNYALFSNISVYDNIAFGLRIRKVPRDEIRGRVVELAERLELGEILNRRADRLDLSAAQRVALARTVITEPRVLLLDEPLNNIRPGLRESLRTHLKRLQSESGQTVVYVTHDQEEALSLGDQIVVMRDGHVEQVGAPADVYFRPETRFVAEFIGRPPMNLLEGSAERGVVNGPWGELAVDGSPGTGSVLLGVRPEHLHGVAADQGDLVGRVLASQSLGRYRLLNVDVGGRRLWTRAAEAAPMGAEVGISVERDRIVVFDGASGRAL